MTPSPYLSWVTWSWTANVSAGGAGAGALNGLSGRWRRAAARGAFIVIIMRLPGPKPATVARITFPGRVLSRRIVLVRRSHQGAPVVHRSVSKLVSTDVAARQRCGHLLVRKTTLHDSSAHRAGPWPAPTKASTSGRRAATN